MAQDTKFTFPDTTKNNSKSILFQKQYWGFSFNSSWTSIGNLFGGKQVEPFFFKPSVGGGFAYKKYINDATNIGFGISLNYQQRGAGIYYPDDNDMSNIDSTTRWRFRFHTFELPINLLLRSKKCVGKSESVRWSAEIGLIPSYTHLARRVYISAEDGFHTLINETNNFQQFNVLGNLSAGIDIDAGEKTMFQVHFQTQLGLNNAYRNDFSQFQGRHILFGVKISALFY
ncbi:MAG: hypothetical protein EAZ85_14600 [Bacteroidetes bacterium]|nr:MAG: hypothetical protein EAZ85_14600 [Bacteroidota bacterium]TAG94109.1 MAG: hypothetical protein EAZ20_01175 [Bacteroidota bacterium]